MTRKTKSFITYIGIFILMYVMTPIATMAQKKFSLEELNFGGKNFWKYRPESRSTSWWGNKLIHLEKDNCFIVNIKNGKESKLFSLSDINNIVNIKSLKYISFPYPNRPIIAININNKIVLLNFKLKKIESQIDISKAEKAMSWNKKTGALAYVNKDQLFVTDGNGDTKQLTTDGSREIVYGQAVHRDEFGIKGGLYWSPNGEQLAFYRMDQSMVTDFPLIHIQEVNWKPNKGESRIATPEPTKYPMAGETLHKVTVGVYNINTKKTIYLNAGDPTDRYFTNIQWSPDSKTIYMFELNRDQNDCRLVSYNAKTGEKIAELYRETNDKYVEPLHPIIFLPWNSNQFVMQSQKDGFNHLYLFDKSGKELKQITSGKWVVMEMLGFNTKEKSIIYASNECSPIQRNIWKINIENTGKKTLLDNGKGYHWASVSYDGENVLDIYSEPTVPKKIDLIKVSNKPLRFTWLTAKDPWIGYNIPEFTCGKLKADDGKTDLYWRMIKPINFDPNKKYPTVIYVYGGPHAHNVDASWHFGSRPWETYMAQKGYLLFVLDNRGSENRGREFEQATFRQLGQVEMRDQMTGVKYLKSLPYVDSNRIGVHGWSFGGFMTVSLITNYPETFKVAVAGGPVIDWKWYEAIYGERYMDTPQTNPEGYAKTSLLSKAKNLKGKLQIITGLNDPVVLPQHCLTFLKACIAAGTQPDFFVYPGEPHNMRGHQSVHLHERITQYFEDYLK